VLVLVLVPILVRIGVDVLRSMVHGFILPLTFNR